MNFTKKYTVTGHDVRGVPRVFGRDKNIDIAETRCTDAAVAYVKDRPDTGPLSKWTFTATERKRVVHQ